MAVVACDGDSSEDGATVRDPFEPDASGHGKTEVRDG